MIFEYGWVVVLAFAAGMLVERHLARRRRKRFEAQKAAIDAMAANPDYFTELLRLGGETRPPKK